MREMRDASRDGVIEFNDKEYEELVF